MGALFATIGRRPLVAAALLFAAGVATGAPGAALAAVGPATMALLLAAGVSALAAACARRAPGLATLLILLAFFAGGRGAAAQRARISAAVPTGTEATVEGMARSAVRLRDGSTRLLLEVGAVLNPHGWTAARHALVVTAPSTPRLRPGDRVRARVRVADPPPALNPGGPDLAARCRREAIAGYGTVIESQIVILGAPSALRAAVESLRDRFRSLLADAVLEPDARALVAALAVGDRTEMSDEASDAFNASGLAHLLSVSGLHVAVVAAALFRALRALLARSERVLLHLDVQSLASVASLPAIAFYVLLTGSEVPAVRSGIMAGAVLLAPVLRRDRDGPSALGAALLAVLAWDPAALSSVSFQLSFAAVAGLMLFTRPLRALIPVPPPAPDARGPAALARRAREALLQTAAATLAASLATAPIVAGVFHRASLVAVLANLAGLPIASVLTVLCAAAAVLAAFAPAAAGFAAVLADPLARLLLAATELFATLPGAAVPVAAPGWLVLAGWYGGLAALGLRARRRPRLALAAAAAALLLAAVGRHALQPRLSRELRVTFFSVGQGDSALLQLPGGPRLLVDGGGDPSGRRDPGERILLPALVELGATRLDAVALSHPHPDHALGLRAVLQRLRVGELWLPRGAERGELLDGLLALARGRGVRVRELAAGDLAAQFGAVRVEVLHPPRDAAGLAPNDASLVLCVRYRGASFVFAGDIEAGVETALAPRLGPPASVLKVPHHGSSTSSTPELVGALRPQHAVFSVGRANQFGFPNPEVLARYQAAGSRIWRTDLDGAVTFWTDGTALDAAPFVAHPLPPR